MKNKNKEHILNQIMNMWQNDIIEGNGTSSFRSWCEDNIHTEEQKKLLSEVESLVDELTHTLSDEYDEVSE